MAKSIYVLSTLTADNRYTAYEQGPNDVPVAVSSVLIHGGANVADKRIVTPRGVVTAITEKELDAIQADEVFKLHVKNGFITIETKKPYDVDSAVANQESADLAAPLTEQDYVVEGKKAPTTSGDK